MFVDTAHRLLRVLIIGPMAYCALILTLRVMGKRTLAKMNAFDFVVTVALGSTLATILLSKDVALLEGVLAFVVLTGLQFIIVWTVRRSDRIEAAVKSAPSMLLQDGAIDDAALAAERVTVEEVKSAVRKSGCGDLSQIAAVFLEADGSFTVIGADKAGSRSAFPGR